MVNDFNTYMIRKSEKDVAYQDYCRASARLELAQIKERLAETRSQHEPIAKLLSELKFCKDCNNKDRLPCGCSENNRNILDRIATYVVCGNKNI